MGAFIACQYLSYAPMRLSSRLIAVELAVVRLKRAPGRRRPPLGSLPPDGLVKGLTWAGDNHDQGLQLAKHPVDGTVGAADEPATWPARAGSDSGALGE